LPKPVDPGAVLRAVSTPAGSLPTSTEGRQAGGWVTGLSQAEATDLLDWLEANNYPPTDVTLIPGEGFAVRCPLGYRPAERVFGK
jgi:hypothetical protein